MACWVFSFYVGGTREAVRRIKEARVFECGALQASAPYAGWLKLTVLLGMNQLQFVMLL